MGKKDSFNVGDLVFAKVKGYPAWPAKIVDITKSKKYSVYFYGTGESANVNGKDISLYTAAKDKLATSSSMKKPDFKAAIDQIESALQGDDPAPNSYEIPLDKSNATFDNTLNSTFEPTEVSSNSTKVVDESTVYEDNDDAEVESDTKDEPAETTVTDNDVVTESTEINNSNNMDQDNDNHDSVISDAAASEPSPSEADIQSLPSPIEKEAETAPVVEKPVEKVAAAATATPVHKVIEKVEKAEAVSTTVGDNVQAENKAEDKKQSRSGRIIKRTKKFDDEIEDTPQAPIKRKRQSELQATVPAKISKKQSDDTSVVTAAESNEGDTKRVSQVIMNEVNLLQYDVDIKSSLQLTSADTARCISVLEKYKTLEVTALMLKKNPQVAETIKRLRRYVGNTKEWNLSDDQTAEFNDKAAKIRKLAELIYKNFKKLFSFPSNVSFWQGFTDEVQSFKEQTKTMSHDELITMVDDVQSTVNQPIEVKNSIRV